MAGLGIVDVVPEHGRMVALDEFPHVRVSVFAVSLALRLHRFIIRGNADGTRYKSPVVAAGVVEAHAQTLFADGGSQLTNNVARSMLPFGWQLRVWRRTGPEGKSIMMLGGEHDIFRAGVMEYFGPCAGIPFLNLPVEVRSKVVVIVVSAIMLAMVGLGRRSVESHAVQVPLRIGIVTDVVLRSEVMLRMNERSPAGNGIETPVNEYPKLCVSVPLRKWMPIERFNSGLIVGRGLGGNS